MFNRVIVTLLALLMLIGAGALLVAPDAALATAEGWLAALRPMPAATLTWVAAGLLAVALLLALAEVWPQHAPRVFTARFDGGTVAYPREAVASVLEKEIATVEGLREARVAVGGRGQKVEVHVRLAIDPRCDPQGVAVLAAGRVRDRVERGMGLRLRDLRLSIVPTEAQPTAPERAAHPAA
ncbi:MAG: hypothetical protein HY691_02055 [Chloroflexi bacterium]|nr:hypothetical protein [Chloroflexota bacterium]